MKFNIATYIYMLSYAPVLRRLATRSASLPNVTEDERAFWSAIVQIVPVILLALVVEARVITPDPREFRRLLKKASKSARRHDETLAVHEIVAERRRRRRRFFQAYLLLVISLMMLLTECIGLLMLYAGPRLGQAMFMGQSASKLFEAMALLAVIFGLVMVALTPVALAFFKTRPSIRIDHMEFRRIERVTSPKKKSRAR